MEVGAPQLPIPKSRYGTQGHRPNPTWVTPTGLSPSMAGLSRPLRLPQGGGGLAHNPTSPHGFPWGFSLGCSPFARRYSGNPVWFLFLPLLGCFRSGGSRSLPGAPHGSNTHEAGSPIRGSRDLRLRAPTPGLSQLATPFIGAQAKPSTRRRGVPGLLEAASN